MRRRRELRVEAGDGTLLYARQTWVPGASGTPMICANGIGVSTIFWHYLEDHFAPTRPVICFDYRGHGESEFPRDLNRLTIEENARDAIAVLDAFGHERAIFLGHSMGCQVIYTCAYQDPERVVGLVPCLGALGAPVHTFLDREMLSLISFVISYRVGLALPDLVTAVKLKLMSSPRGRVLVSWLARKAGLVHPTRMPQRDLDAYLDHFAALSPVVFLRMAENMATHNAEPRAHEIVQPTLVVAGERDLFTPFYLSEEVADRLPNAELFVFREGSHAAIVEQPAALHGMLERFIAEFALDATPVASS
ncbi:MAG: alpha/beta hydrolase [Planctomycetes bacterium]|nr:alpha/beta hydrolase [Planctomycetota bacterium]